VSDDPRLDASFDAYRASEPVRTRDPFADPRLRAIAEERAHRHATPWYRRLIASPAPALAGAALALLLAVGPIALPDESMFERAQPLVSASEQASPLLAGAEPAPVSGDATPAADPSADSSGLARMTLLALAGALGALALRQLRRRS
jgi:hypothetical protein